MGNSASPQSVTEVKEGVHEVQAHINNAKNAYEGGDMERALQSIFQALTLNSGEDIAKSTLMRLRAELTEAESTHESPMDRAVRISSELVADSSTILSERGESGILKDAFEDGSSYVCTTCGGLVSFDRIDAHRKFWCEHADGGDDDDGDGDGDGDVSMSSD